MTFNQVVFPDFFKSLLTQSISLFNLSDATHEMARDFSSSFVSFESLFLSAKKPSDAYALSDYLNQIKVSVIRQVHYYALLTYFVMESTQNWGEVGEQQVKSSLCRLLLDIPTDQDITYQDTYTFRIKLSEQYREYGMDQLSLDEAKEQIDTLSLKVGNESFSIHEIEPFNQWLSYLGCDLYIQGGIFGEEKELILGEGHSRMVGNYTVFTLTKEISRTPNIVTSMAAAIGEKSIFIRQEALQMLFYIKWLPVWEGESHYLYSDKEAFSLSQRIKQEALTYFGATDPAKTMALKDTVVESMCNLVTYHELGHGVIQHSLLDQETATMGESLKILGDDTGLNLLEILAEYAPKQDALFGPLYYIVETSKTDHDLATAMFFQYVSDAWFYDTQDEYMFSFSNLMISIMVAALAPGRVQFDRLAALLDPESDASAFSWAVGQIQTHCKQVKDKIEQLETFKKDGQDVSLNELKVMIRASILKRKEYFKEGSYAFDTHYWSELFTVVSKSLYIDDLKAYFDVFKTDSEERLLTLLNATNGTQYETLQGFIYGQVALYFSGRE